MPVGHPALVAAVSSGVDVVSEIELAWQVLEGLRGDEGGARASYRLLAITGTNGKTTVTGLVTAMLSASGMTAVAAGNVGYPLLDAVAALTRASRRRPAPAPAKSSWWPRSRLSSSSTPTGSART